MLVNVDENRRETIDAIEAWGDAAPEIVVTHPRDPDDNLALVDQLAAVFAGAPGLAERAAALRAALADELAATRAERPAGAPRALPDLARPVDDGRARHLPLAHARPHRLADAARRRGGYAGAARYPALTGDEPWLGASSGCCSAPSRSLSRTATSPRRRRCARRARCMRVDGELLSWYGSRAVAGLRYLRALADDDNARAALARLTPRARRPWTS